MFVSTNSQGHTIYKELLNTTHERSLPVHTISFEQLTDLVGGSIDFIKINAEGAEFDILSSPAFARVKEAIVEVHLQGADARRLLADVERTHYVQILEDRSPRFLFAHLKSRNSN